MVAVLLDVTIEDEVVLEAALEILLDDAVGISELLRLLKGVEAVSVPDDELLDSEGEEKEVVEGAAESVSEATGTSLLAVLVRRSDVVDMTGTLVMVGRELSEPVNKVVIALMVAVIVPAMFGMAPFIPSQTV